MKVEYGDDIAYVRLGSGKVVRTEEVAPGVLMDFDGEGQAVGLEVMGLERRGLAEGVVEVEMRTGSEPPRPEEEAAARRLLAAAVAERDGRRAQSG